MLKIIFSLMVLAAPASAQVEQINAFRGAAGLSPVSAEDAAANLAAIPEPEQEDILKDVRGASPQKIGDKLVGLMIRHPKAMHLVEYPIFKIMGYAHKRGKLVPALEHALRSPLMAKFLPPLPPAKREDYIKKFPRMIAAQLEGGGYVRGAQAFEEWEKMSERHIGLMKASKFKPQAKAASLFTHPGYLAELEEITRVPFSAGHSVEPLVNGPASFAARERIIRGARRSVYLMVWGFYDDVTGKITRDLLIAKKNEGLDVRVMVDGNISNFLGKESFAALAEAGVPVARFWDAERKYDGMHSKILVVDGETAVTGGMNIGDKYSHLNPDSHHWRDTDVLFSGPAAADAERIFAATWNGVAASQNLEPLTAAGSAAAAGPVRAALVYQRADAEPAIYLSLLKAIYGATSSVNIENAYFVTIPSLKTALSEAVERGVKVRILTNSAQSNNEPILTSFILESLAEMKAAGAEIYVKEGETLHSKFLTVDGLFATVGSYNFHPKSIRHEREVTLHVVDRDFAGQMEAVFAQDIAAARPIADSAELGLKDNPLNYLARRYMFDQL
ncbi:MAG: phosphatidylserine/phosphatidylglycerophosphate/cardiolipin synthase family protein [Elusimicrobiales bacterium]|nr:phosphatidylserine/phosphatidylglycerophosphate/cardiolipin synthase family protein [Elusimicrobiales bacterium]